MFRLNQPKLKRRIYAECEVGSEQDSAFLRSGFFQPLFSFSNNDNRFLYPDMQSARRKGFRIRFLCNLCFSEMGMKRKD